MNTNPKSYPSICIPHTWGNTTWMQVKEVFEQLFGPGSIERVDIVKRHRPVMSRQMVGQHNTPGSTHDVAMHQQEFCKVFIHFKEWPDTEEANKFRTHILEGNCMKIVYNEPWYWKCYKNNSQRKSYNGGAKPYIKMEDPSGPPCEGGAKMTDPPPSTF